MEEEGQRIPLPRTVLQSGYEILAELGKGSFSTVHLAIERKTKNKVALKVLLTSSADEPDLHFGLVHDNIISLFHSFEIGGGKLVMVLEYAKNGDLFHYVRSKVRLADTQAKVIFLDIVNGLCFLHSLSIVHRDLKPNNVLIDDCHRAKLADFGHAKRCVTTTSSFRTSPPAENCYQDDCKSSSPHPPTMIPETNSSKISSGHHKDVIDKDITTTDYHHHVEYPAVISPAYAAPEVIDGLLLRNPMPEDIWSLGVILFYMVSGFLPFGSHTVAEIRQAMDKPLRWLRPLSCVSRPCRRLVEAILTIKPSERPTCIDIRNNCWMNETNSKKYI